MPAPNYQQKIENVPLEIVGSTKFGRYPKISVEQTYNMIISDNALVDYSGYKNVLPLAPNLQGRGLYSSTVGSLMLAVLGSQVYTIDENLISTFRGNLGTSSGEVFIDENNGAQIGITDGVNLYIYNYNDESFKISNVDFTFVYSEFEMEPGYISFQNGRFLIAALNTSFWVLSDFNDGTSWPDDSQHIGSLQTKPDTVQAAIPFPGRGNQLFLFGNNVTEAWNDVGAVLFPYQRASNFNLDYGCLSASSIAALGKTIVWLAGNETSGPVIMFSEGGDFQEISTDGIDFQFAQLTNPFDCSGFLIKQDGHLLYQFTFKTDNLSYVYDFDTKKFFTVTDEFLNYHVARKVVFFNNNYYFVSWNDGNLYEIGTQFTNYQYSATNIKEIPRIRITPPLRRPNQRYFIIKSIGFTIENGRPNIITESSIPSIGNNVILLTEDGFILTTENGIDLTTEQPVNSQTSLYKVSSQAIDMSVSRDGGENFGNAVRIPMNPTGKRKSRFIYQRVGQANDTSFQFRFWGFDRFVCMNGEIEVYE